MEDEEPDSIDPAAEDVLRKQVWLDGLKNTDGWVQVFQPFLDNMYKQSLNTLRTVNAKEEEYKFIRAQLQNELCIQIKDLFKNYEETAKLILSQEV